MSAEYSAEEVREMAKAMKVASCVSFHPDYAKDPEHRVWSGDASNMLTAYAERIEEDEGSACDHRWVTDGFGPTTCTKCGRTSPPAQAAQVPADLADFVREMHTLELYNASTIEPYFDYNGSDMWCSTEDFAGKDGEKFVRFLFGCAEFVKTQLNAAPTAEPVAQGEAEYVPLTLVETIINSLRDRGDYLSVSAATQLERLATQPHSPDAADSGRVSCTREMAEAALNAPDSDDAIEAMMYAVDAALAAQRQSASPAGVLDANRLHFIVKHNWIGTATRCERHIQDGDLDSARRAVDAAMLAASPTPPKEN